MFWLIFGVVLAAGSFLIEIQRTRQVTLALGILLVVAGLILVL